MPKRAHIALSAVLSLLAMASPVVAGGKRSVAMAPYMIPAAAPPRPVAGVKSTAVSVSSMRRLAAGTYPAGHLQRGQYLQQKGDIDGALVEFLKAAQENPLQVKAFYEQAKIFKQKGYNKLAESSLQQALAVKPDYRDARVLLASIYLESGNVSQATKELVRSLGLESDGAKQTSAQSSDSDRFLGIPIQVPTIVQTPHGLLRPPAGSAPARHAQSGDASAATDPFASPRPADEIKQARTKTAVTGDIPSAFSAQQSKPSDPDEDILKRVLGMDPNAAPPVQPDSKVPPQTDAASQVTLQQAGVRKAIAATTGATATTSSQISDPNATTVKPVSADEVQQILQQVNKHKSGGGFSFLNPFGWFGGDDKPAQAQNVHVEKAPPEDPMLRKAEERARKSEKQGRGDKHRVAAWMDGLLDSGKQKQGDAGAISRSVTETTPLRTVILNDQGENDFNPLNAIETKAAKADGSPDAPVRSDAAPVADTPPPVPVDESQPVVPKPMDISNMFKRAVAWLPLPIFKPSEKSEDTPEIKPSVPDVRLLNLAPPPAPTSLPTNSTAPVVPPPALQSHADQYIAKLPAPIPVPVTVAPALAPAPATAGNAVAPTVAPAPLPVHIAKPLVGILGFIPREIAGTLAHVLSPKQVQLATNNAAPPIQELRKSADQSPVPVMGKNVYDNIVGARFGSSSMSEESNPVLQKSGRPPKLIAQTPLMAPVRKQTMLVELAPKLSTENSSSPALPVPSTTAGPTSGSAPAAPATNIAFMPVQPIYPPQPAAHVPPPVQAQPPVQQPQPIQPQPIQPQLVPRQAFTQQQAPAPGIREYRSAAGNQIPLQQQIARTQPIPQAERLAAQGFHFITPQLSPQQQQLMKTLRTVQPPAPHLVAGKPMVDKSVILPEDAWAKRMKYLLEHGTNSLAPGEAFMFSEETGEGVLFLADHSSIRRKIAMPQDHEQVARLRRPDILNQKGELQYNLSLLGKIIKPGDAKKPVTATKSTHGPTAPVVEDPPDSASVEDLLGGKQAGFFGWLKSVFRM